ncbi:MAG: precorrin-6A reductase [Veillonellaceae bacterium]|jgi:precorrin-6A/cobalt-precorrin-6A reductase|nr:precorrin-6A reductase [Veillonellaceae bacterium]
MILVLAGTKDGRQLAANLAQAGHQVVVSVVSKHGRDLAAQNNLVVNTDKLDANAMVQFIQFNHIKLVIDGSHPYAVNVSQNAIKACQITNTKYLRYERPALDLPYYDKLHIVTSYHQAARQAANLGQVIFLTTGSRMLGIFTAEPKLKNHRLIARVLPDPQVITQCVELGFGLNDIIALQGPFSHQLNYAMFKDFGAEVLIMKNSGQIGGSDTKLSAAMELNLSIIVIDRPKINYDKVVFNYDQILEYVQEVFK